MPKQDAPLDVRRAVRQQLQDWQRAGLTHLPKLASSRVANPATVSTEVPAVGVTDEEVPPPAVQPPSQQTPDTQTAVVLDDRQVKLAACAEKVAACTRCQVLAATRKQTVFGVGNSHAKIMFIGEAPGAEEDRQGEPFVGPAGQLLNKIITASRLTRDEVYICNILKCRPPDNRTPLPEEAGNCREYLDAQIAIIDPDYIVCWGAVAAQNLLDSTQPIGRMRGRFLSYGRAKVLCTYHPSYLLRTPSAKKQVWDDMKFLMRDMGVELEAGKPMGAES